MRSHRTPTTTSPPHGSPAARPEEPRMIGRAGPSSEDVGRMGQTSEMRARLSEAPATTGSAPGWRRPSQLGWRASTGSSRCAATKELLPITPASSVTAAMAKRRVRRAHRHHRAGDRRLRGVRTMTPQDHESPVVVRSAHGTLAAQWCVYDVRMARVNVYLPDELIEEARAAGLNVSSVAQRALRQELTLHRSDDWLGRVKALPRTSVEHSAAVDAIDAARSDLGW
jgi:post-segregation antitoxin (ccd killing protein)